MYRLQVTVLTGTVTKHCYANYPSGSTHFHSASLWHPYNQMETSKNLSQNYVWQPNTTSLGNSEPIDDLLFAHGSLAGELQSLTIGPVQHCLARHLTTAPIQLQKLTMKAFAFQIMLLNEAVA